MFWWRRLWQWRDDRVELSQHRLALDEIHWQHQPAIDDAMRKSGDDWRRALAERDLEQEFHFDIIDEIETRRRRLTAARLGIPIPEWPKPFEGDENWNWNPRLNRHVLTDKGHAHLRREIAFETEILYKPWLSLTAVAISLVSLIVSMANAIWG